MARIELTPDFEEQNIGQIIIFCEGQTEKHYFDYFAEIIKNKYTDIKVETQTAGGNAQTVLNYANEFLADASHNQRYRDYGKYLVFDCDAPKNIQNVINNTAGNDHNYNILVSHKVFETWLLMYFEDVNEKLTKSIVYRRLESHLNIIRYKKANKGIIRAVLHKGNFERAMDNADKLMKMYSGGGLTVYGNIEKMNPYTNVHELVKQFMIAIS
jgi:hypothetical protein